MPAVLNGNEFLSANLDYLIIGGGTTGLTVAARLSEEPSCVVGVLEAGDYHEHDAEISVPGMMGQALQNPELNWGLRTAPQRHVDDRKLLVSSGKGIGGSSSINFCTLFRPAKRELDCWEELGNPGWNWDSLLHYMKKSERLDPVLLTEEDRVRFTANPEPRNHGSDGPIHHSFPRNIFQLHDKILDASETLGLPRNPDPYGGHPNGGFLALTSVDSGNSTRSSAATGYYAPNISRPNLLVLTGAHVTKITLEGVEGGLQRATGATFTKDGKEHATSAKRGVILSAGAFQSPQLLELSGIGNKEILEPLGIRPKIDLPGVGENLQDHGLVTSVVEVDPTVETMEVLREPEQLAKHQKLYQQNQGLFASIPASFFAFLPASLIAGPDTIQSWISSSTTDASPNEVFKDARPEVKKGIQRGYEITRTFVDDPNIPVAQLAQLNSYFHLEGVTVDTTKRYFSLVSVFSHPFSRGTTHITSADPLSPPSIQSNYYSNPADIDITLKAIKFALKIFETPPLKEKVVRNVALAGDATDEELIEYARRYLQPGLHTVGTCAMMPREFGGVVDSELRVYGTTNLRVADISIAPLEVSSNTQTLAYAIGEKAADIIKGFN